MILERLPPRITSFFDRNEPPRTLDAKAFKSACYVVAQTEGGSVEALDFDLLARSYYAVTVRTKADHVSVLCNSVYPYLGFVPPGSFGFAFDLEFVAPARLATAFTELTEFEPLDADWLNREVRPELLRDLAPNELREVKHWKPHRMGEVIFNSWD